MKLVKLEQGDLLCQEHLIESNVMKTQTQLTDDLAKKINCKGPITS